jgi:tetrahydromethanopterin S-methyltransferase subunit G
MNRKGKVVTVGDIQTLETRLDRFEKSVDDKIDSVHKRLESVIRLEENVKYIADSLKGCPMCKNSVTSHEVEIGALKSKIDDINQNLDAVWKRLWAFVWVAVIIISGTVVSVGAYFITH